MTASTRGLFVAALVLACQRAAALPTFSNVTGAAGIVHSTTLPNCPTCAPTFLQEQSGGAAVGDFDGDGWPDVFITRYWDTDLLYRNNGDGTFADVTAMAFPGGMGAQQTNGVAWGDVNNDGHLDLIVSTINASRHLLYINNGAGQFAEEGLLRGLMIDEGAPLTAGSGVALGDYDGDGYLDVYIAEWRGFSTPSQPAQARLFRNLGAAGPGQFVDVTAAAGVGMDIVHGIHAGKGLSFTPRFADLDRDGRPDLAVAADGGASRIFWNNGDGTFTDGTAAAGINTGTNDMGFTLADFNGNGRLDWFVTSIGTGSGQHPSGNRLFLNNGDRTFADATYATGVREGGWGWGAEALDYDNDGDLDLIHTNGMLFAAPDQTAFFLNLGSRTNPQFAKVSGPLGVTDVGQGRGLVTLDYDRDGDLDVLIVNFGEPPILYRNNGGNDKHWLQVQTVGSSSNRDGVGAVVRITPNLHAPEVFAVAEISASSTYLSQSEMLAHFGLGTATTVDLLEIVWPSGVRQQFFDVGANQRLKIVESLRGDFDGDDNVDGDDLSLWRQFAGLTAGALPGQGDADRNGAVDGHDFLLWQRELGRAVVSGIVAPAPGAEFVPEPMAVVLLAAGVMAAVGVRRERLRRLGQGRGLYARKENW